MRKRFAISAVCGIFAAAGVLWTRAQEPKKTMPETKPAKVAEAQANHAKVSPELTAADSTFGFRLFHTLPASPKENVFISPVSIALALQMTYNGAQSTTQQAMAHTLALNGMPLETLNANNAALIASLQNVGKDTTLNIANSLWYKPSLVPKPDFLKRNQDYYGAEIADLSGGAGRVNAWVSDHTNGKIPSIVSQGDLMGIDLVLLNAVYFKGKWEEAFQPAQTTDEKFSLLDKSTKPCKMMHQHGWYNYYKGDGFQMATLPYKGDRLSLVLLLPDKTANFPALLKSLTPEHWETWTKALKSKEGNIGLPRFKSNYSIGLTPALAALGMESAFDPQKADFRGMFAQNAFINDVQHKTFLAIDEEGTEAAAVTGIMVDTLSMPMRREPPFTMVCDHPFVCAIRDTQTGAMLFLGAIVNP